jgi:hypothetical protein
MVKECEGSAGDGSSIATRGPDRAPGWHKLLPFEPAPASDRLGCAGLEAASAPAAPSAELDRPAVTHHTLVLFSRPPDELELRYEGLSATGHPHRGGFGRAGWQPVLVALARDQGVDASLPGAGAGRAGRRRGIRLRRFDRRLAGQFVQVSLHDCGGILFGHGRPPLGSAGASKPAALKKMGCRSPR